MSTDWNIECRKCGYTLIGDGYGVRHYGLAELCASSMLVRPKIVYDWWAPIIQSDSGHSIHLFDIPTNCTHDFEPRNEYGDWATPNMWPDGHPKSMVITCNLPGQCTAGGESRCG